MAVLSITVPDAALARVVEAFAQAYGYQATLPDGTANPQTKAQFARARLAAHARDVLRGCEAAQAAEAARLAAAAAADQVTIS